jgi:hypothetical protein
MCFGDGDDIVGFIPDAARVKKPKAATAAQKRAAAALADGGVTPKRTASAAPRAKPMCRACRMPLAGHKCPLKQAARSAAGASPAASGTVV